ncbi:MAG TPA: ABC transporter substrate-binding protein [Actinomycetota bacterium]|nr:ABC transporter substrate-binding protein [Actinomycetota bacterium]
MSGGRISRRQFIKSAGGTAVGGLALGSLGGLLAACSSGTSAGSKHRTGQAGPLNRDPKTLVVAVDAFLPDFDPASYFLLSGIVTNYGIYEGLLRMKGSSATEVEPVLAERYRTNSDASVWTFSLRSGVKFSDGTPFDGNALKAAYTRTITAGLGAGSTLSTYITDPGTQIVVKDPGTVVFDLGLPVPRFDLLLASQYGTGVVNPNVESRGKNHGHDYLTSHSAGTGAYMVESVSPNDQVVLVQNPYYWRGWGSQFEKIIIRQVEEDSSRRQGMEAGDFDIAFPGTPQGTAALRTTPGIVVGDQKVMGMEYVVLGEYGPLASPEARRAMNLLFPHDEFLSSVMEGTLEPPNSVIPDLILYSDPGSYPRTTDVDQARQLLQQAGVPQGTELTYEYYPGRRKEPGLVLQQQLQQVGMSLKLVEKAYPAFVADMSTDRPASERASMYYWFWWPEYNSPSDYLYPILSEDATPKAALFNSGYYMNDTVNKAINDGYTVSDDQKLTAMWKRAQEIMGREDPPWIPIGQIVDTSYLRGDIKGYVANPLYVLTYDYYALSRAS